jgi:hypothetical protein
MYRIQQLLSPLLELIPSSHDLQRYRRLFPSFPGLKLDVRNAAMRLCLSGGKKASDSIYRWTNELISQIVNNRNQSVALFFLFGLIMFFLGGRSQSIIYQPIDGVARGTTTITLHDRFKNVPHAPDIVIPPVYDYLTATNHSNPLATVPVMAYLPRSGGNTIAQILGQCEGMILGGVWTGGNTDSLKVVHEQGVKQVNADFSTKAGRETARNQGLKEIHNLLILTQNLVDSAQLFADPDQAELWIWARHPVERQISLYYYKQSLQPGHPHYDANVFLYSLSDWAQSALHTPNAMMYVILGQPQSPLGFSTADLIIAKTVLRQKAKIGLLDQKAESIRRFLHGRVVGAAGGRECKEKLLDYAWKTKNYHPKVRPNSDEYEMLVQRNSWDMKLWEYLQYLYHVQGRSVLEGDDEEE